MARIFFMAFEAAGQYPLVKRLRNLGHKIILTEPRYPAFYDLLKQQVPAPELFVCDASIQPSHARECGNYIRSLKSHKQTPFILYNVRAADEATTKERVPNAVIVNGDDPLAAIDEAVKPKATSA